MEITDSEIEALHKKYAPNSAMFDLVYTHCRIVAEIADELAEKSGVAVDKELVHIGCMLHDIGVYGLYSRDGMKRPGMAYIQHGTLGYDLLKKEGYPEGVCRFASCHTGVGLTESDIISQELPIPPGNYTAQTVNERLVMYADKFHSKTNPPRFNSAASYTLTVGRFGQDKVVKFERLIDEFGEPDLDALVRRYGYALDR